MITVKKINYNLFDHDIEHLKKHMDTSFHEIDGEIEITFDNAKKTYISWSQCSEGYKILRQEDTFFSPPSEFRCCMSQHQFWCPFINSEIQIQSIGEYGEILVISSTVHKLYICCYELKLDQWGQDTLYITNKYPNSIIM